MDVSSVETKVRDLNLLERSVNAFVTGSNVNVLSTFMTVTLDALSEMHYTILINYENVSR